jgi:hypothetical protein
MTNAAEKMMNPDANRPDKFQSTKPWKTKVFRYSAFGAVAGAIIFGIFGLLIIPQSFGWPFIFALALTGLIFTAVMSGLFALYTRDFDTKNGKGA